MTSCKTTINCLILLLTAMNMVETQNANDILIAEQNRIFENFKSKHGKKYKDASQQLYRNLIVFKNAKKISDHNLNNQSTYTLGINQFADLTQQEFKIKFANFVPADQNIRNKARIIQKKEDLSQNICQCDTKKMTQLKQMKKNDSLVRNQLNQQAKNRKIARDAKFADVAKNISNFPSKLQLLPPDQYIVTMNKIRQDSNKTAPNSANSKKSDTGNSNTSKSGITVLSTNNLQKNSPTQNGQINGIQIIPTSLSGVMSNILQLRQKLTNVLSSDYLNIAFGPLGLQPLSKPSLNITQNQTQTNVVDTSQQAIDQASLRQTVLKSLGDAEIAMLENYINAQSTDATLTSDPISTDSTQISKQILGTSNASSSTTNSTISSTISNSTFNIDWSNYTNSVRYQGLCGACYSLAAVSNFEMVLSIYVFNFPILLSAQQIIDCANNSLTYGCDGGHLEGSYLFMKTNGITTDYVYPYRSGNTGVPGACKTLSGPFKIISFRNLPEGDCDALKTELRRKPVSLGIASANMQLYQSGVFNNCTNQIDHAVLLVGFNSTKGWKIKNSWGAGWGEAGYAWLPDGNSCGICSIPTVPVISSQPPY